MGDLGRSVGDSISNAFGNVGQAIGDAVAGLLGAVVSIPGGPLWLVVIAVFVAAAWFVARR